MKTIHTAIESFRHDTQTVEQERIQFEHDIQNMQQNEVEEDAELSNLALRVREMVAKVM